MRTFTANNGYQERVFRGFDRKIKSSELIALAYIEGVPETWAIEESRAIKEICDCVEALESYYAFIGVTNLESIHVYRLVGVL